MASRVLSIRLREQQMEGLTRLARRLGRTPSETAGLLLDEALRAAAFGHIDFRNSPVGRQAYVSGTSLAVWEVVSVARLYGNEATRTAEHLHWPVVRVQAALEYAAAFPEEIAAAIEDNAAYDVTAIRRLLPQTEVFAVAPPADREQGASEAGRGAAPAAR